MPTSYDAVLADSPVGFWRLNETSGTTFADSSGNGHDGTFSGATLGQAAINPDNTGSVVGTSSGYGVGYVANTGNWMPSGTTWTAEMWVRPNNTDDVVGLMARYNTDTTGGWIIWQRSGKLSLTVINTSGQQDGVGVTLTAGEVSHVALKQSGSTFTFYVNGRGVWRYTVSGGWSGGANNNRLQIGGYNGAGQWSRANFSDVALFSTALSDDRIAAHAATKLTTATPAAPTAIPNVRGWWDASAITGVTDNTGITSWSDSSSNGKTVTASTAPKYRTAVLNNKAVVRFVGNGDNMTAASVLSAATSSFTMSVLVRVPAKQASASAKPMALATSTGNGMTFILDSTPTRGIFAPGNYATFTGGLYTVGDWERWTLVGSGSTVTLYVNNIAVQVATLQQAQTSVSLGGAIGFTDNWPIDIAEAAVWDRALTTSERNSYDTYLYNKWFSTAPAIPVGTGSGSFSVVGSASGVAPSVTTGTYLSLVLADAPLAYYRLEETTGAPAVDSSGNGRNADWTGSPARGVAGAGTIGGNGFTTGGGAVVAADAAWNSFTGAFSVELWHKPTGADGYLTEKYTSPGVQGFAFRIVSGKPLMYTLSASLSQITTPSVPAAGVWHHYVFTHDGTNGRLYVDGALAAGPTAMVLPTDGAATLKIGARGDDAALAACGSIDEVAYYNGALSSSRVLAHYNAGNSAPVSGGSATGAFSFAGSATGKRVTAGVAAGAIAFAGVAVGAAQPKGSAVGSSTFTGAAAGVAPAVGPRTGSATGSTAFAGAATGSAPVKGNGSGAFSFTGAASGVTPAVGMKYGTATGSIAWTGAASGAPARRLGSTVGGFSYLGTAAGSNTAIPMGTAAGTILWRGVAFGANGTTTIPGWDIDDSGRTTLGLDTSGELDAMPPLALPPAGYVERPLVRKSVVVPALHTISGRIVDPLTNSIRIPDDVYDALPLAAPVEEIGVPHVIFPSWSDLHDVTYFRGGIIRIGNMRMEEPFGDVTLDLEIPLLTSMDHEPSMTGPEDLFWTINRANVEVVLAHPGGTMTRLWAGHVVSHDIGNDASGSFRRLTAVGSLRQAATDVMKVPNMLEPTDIGTLIPRALNGVASRRYPKFANVSTGIMSRQRGSWSDSPLGYAQSLLSTSFTASGNQWTVAKVEGTRRTYEMRPKDTAVSLTVTNGARGVEVDLTRDATSTRNVIYGHGVADNGYAWWNYKYPNLHGDTAPLYPGSLMGLGATGEGVTTWQQRVRDLGYAIAVDGTISSSDVEIIRTVQRRYGLSVDGVIGPQTWAATFDVGGNGGDLSGVIRLPLAADPRTQPFLYNADGSVAGDNPDFDRNVIIYADDVDFGSGITRAEGIQSAQQILERESEPGLTGRIVLRSDPREMSRFLIRPGRKIKLVGFERADRVLHITAVDVDWQSLSVTLEVDEKSRDAMTVAQIRERDKEARRDPARRPGNVNRRSRLDVDQVVPFDGESGAGRIPKFATYGGLWSVIRIPVSETGRVAMIDMQTSGPTSQLFVAMFGAPIQPAHLVKWVGPNPLSASAKWEQNRAVLEDQFGWIEGFGSADEPGGYWPGLKSNNSPLTGRLKDTGGFEYVSAKPPWIWVAVYTPVSSYVQGRILPAPVI